MANWHLIDDAMPPTEPLRVVQVVEETQVLEGGRALTTEGTWSTVTPFGFGAESVSWSSGGSGLRDLIAQHAGLRSVVEPAGGQRLVLDDVKGWFEPGNDVARLTASLVQPYAPTDAAPGWPARQAFVDLPSGVSTVAYGRPCAVGGQDARLGSVSYAYDAKAGLKERITNIPGQVPLREQYTYTATGFVTKIERSSLGACEPACPESVAVQPDGMELFPAAITNGMGQTTQLVFDGAHGLPTRVTAPDGLVEVTTYDAFERLESSTTEGTTRRVLYKRTPVDADSVSTTDRQGPMPVPSMY